MWGRPCGKCPLWLDCSPGQPLDPPARWLLQVGKHSLRRKREETEGSCVIPREVHTLGPNWSILMQMSTPDPLSLIGPKNTVLISHSGATLISWWRCYWGHSCTAWIGQEWLGPVVEIWFQDLLYNGWLSLQKHSAGKQFSTNGRWLSCRGLCLGSVFKFGPC